MAEKKKAADQFANIAYLSVTESAANTLTFAQLQMATMMMDAKYALIIHRAEWFIGDLASLNSSTDRINIALTLTDRITDIGDQSQPEVLFYQRIARFDLGAAATGNFVDFPKSRDFTNLPGTGILVPADRLYIGIQGAGAAAAMQVNMRLYYTVKELETADYWDLIEARRVMTT